jgi:hypothetical protein
MSIVSFFGRGPDISDPFIQLIYLSGKNTVTQKVDFALLPDDCSSDDILVAWTKICQELEDVAVDVKPPLSSERTSVGGEK